MALVVQVGRAHSPLFLVCSFLFVTCTHSWWQQGHYLVAQIAYDELSPLLQQQMDATCGSDDHGYGFVWAAVWADTIKAIGLDSFNAWHYIDMPFVIGVAGPSSSAPRPDIEWAMRGMARTLFDANSTADTRGFALRMLIHLVADSVQVLFLYSRAV